MVQALDGNNDPIEGPTGPVFLTDQDAVAQIIVTTLRLLRGEWWEDLTLGFPLMQDVLNSSGDPKNQQAIAALIEQTIEACPYVLEVVSFSFSNNPTLRASSFSAEVATAFGTLTVTNAPGTSASVTGS